MVCMKVQRFPSKKHSGDHDVSASVGFSVKERKWDAGRQRARVRRACSCAGPAEPWTGSAAGLRAVPSQMRFRFERNKRPSGATTGRRKRTPLPPSLQSWGVPVELHLDKNGRLFRTARSSPRHTNIEEMGDGGGHSRRPVHSTDGRLFRSNRTLVTYDQPCVPRPCLCTHAYVRMCRTGRVMRRPIECLLLFRRKAL